jgi:hypothetical protein
MRSLTEAPEQELEWLEETIMDPRSQFHCPLTKDTQNVFENDLNRTIKRDYN